MFVFLFLISAALTLTAVASADLRFLYAAITLFAIALWQEHLKEKARSSRKRSDTKQYEKVKKPSNDELKQAHGYAEAYLQGHTDGYGEGYGKGFSEGYSEGYSKRTDDYQEDSRREKVRIPFDPWQILEISPNSSQQAIRKAFREQSKLYHPDLVCHLGRHLREEAEFRTKDINQAYDMLRRR